MSTHWDQKQFNDAVTKMLARTSRPISEATNQTLANVAGRTINYVKKADKEKITRQLGEIGREVEIYKTKKGKLRVKRGARMYAQMNNKTGAVRAVLIINARRARAGKKPLTGPEMERAIRAMVGARKRSVGFIASGLIPGYRKLLSGVSKPFKLAQLQGISVRGKNKGDASPAKPASGVFKCEASFVTTTKAANRQGNEPLRRAMQDERQEIERHLAEKLNPVIKDFNGK